MIWIKQQGEKLFIWIVFNVITKLLGILVVAIAVQFIVKGIDEVFPVLIRGG